MPSKPSQSAEDYLERIHELLESKGTAHVADIAQSLGVGQPSVTSMVQKLADEGYLHYEKYRALTLTCLLYTSPSPRDISGSRMPSSA